jgi:DNA-binding XRE family transcriptional regulator
MEFSDKLKELRTKKGLSQEELAQKLFITRETVSRYESGTRSPDLATLKRIAVFFDVSLDELLGNERALAKTEPFRLKKWFFLTFLTSFLAAGLAFAIPLTIYYFSIHPLTLTQTEAENNSNAVVTADSRGDGLFLDAIGFSWQGDYQGTYHLKENGTYWAACALSYQGTKIEKAVDVVDLAYDANCLAVSKKEGTDYFLVTALGKTASTSLTASWNQNFYSATMTIVIA